MYVNNIFSSASTDNIVSNLPSGGHTHFLIKITYSVSEKISDRYGNENNFSCYPVVCISMKNRCVRKDKHKTLSFGKHKVLF